MNNKKLNNKGITLIELIVSFVIVAVAVIYFYQMLTSVTKMYAKARDGVNHSARVNYAFRIIDAAYNLNPDVSDCPNALDGIATGCTLDNEDGFVTISFDIDKKNYTLYKYSEIPIDPTDDEIFDDVDDPAEPGTPEDIEDDDIYDDEYAEAYEEDE